jgi:hypothetical protein
MTNEQMLNRQQSAYQFNTSRQDRLNEAAADRANRLAIAKLKAAGKGPNGEDVIKAPSFNEFQNRVGTIGTTTTAKGEPKEFIFGSGKSQYGTKDLPVKNQKISGEIYDVTSGQVKPLSKTIDITSGTLRGYMNAWVDKKTGELLKTTTPTSTPRIEYKNGKPYAYKNGKPYEVEERTLAQYDYNASTEKDKTDLKTVYVAAAPKEAMREMGFSNAYYKGMGRVNHGSVISKDGTAKIDTSFIRSNRELSPYLEAFKDAQSKFNNKTAKEADIALLQSLNSYDARKSTYDNEVLPYFKDQAKNKTIVEEE